MACAKETVAHNLDDITITRKKNKPNPENYCAVHETEQLNVYCTDCKRIVCPFCFAFCHKGHSCCDLKEAAIGYIEPLKDTHHQLRNCTSGSREELGQLGTITSSHLNQMVIIENKIHTRYQEVKQVIDKQLIQSLERLDKLRVTKLDSISTRKDLIEKQLIILERLSHTSGELIDNGSEYDIIQSSNNLVSKAGREITSHLATLNNGKLLNVEVTFVESDIKDVTDGRTNLIGRILSASYNEDEGLLNETEKKTVADIEETLKSFVPTVLKLKYEYAPDQWSPLNPTGRKVYDNIFLTNMRFSSQCVVKPKCVDNFPGIKLDSPFSNDLRQAVSSLSSLDPSVYEFTPHYVRQPTAGLIKGVKGFGKMRSGDKQTTVGALNTDRSGRVNVIAGNLDGNSGGRAHVELNRAENPWKPTVLTGRTIEDRLGPDEAKTVVLYRSVLGILNKVVPQNLDVLIDKFISLDIDTEIGLVGVIKILVKKATSERKYCQAYAQLASKMIQVKVPASSGFMVSFGKLLLNGCQAEFENGAEVDSEWLSSRQLEIEATTEDNDKKRLIEEMEAALVAQRGRFLGNINFIAELFKLNILTESIMHDCVRKLLMTSDKDSLECLSHLLTNVGKYLAKHVNCKEVVDGYFASLKKMSEDKQKYTPRYRFMLLDVIELRDNNWIPRPVKEIESPYVRLVKLKPKKQNK